MLGGARTRVLAVVPRFEGTARFVAVVIPVADGARVNKFFLTIDAVKFHNFFSGPRRFFDLPTAHFALDRLAHGGVTP